MFKSFTLNVLLFSLFCLSTTLALNAAKPAPLDDVESVELMARNLSITQSPSCSDLGQGAQHSLASMIGSSSTEELPSPSELSSISPRKVTITYFSASQKEDKSDNNRESQNIFIRFTKKKDREVKNVELSEDDNNVLFINAARTGNTQEIKTILEDKARFSQLQNELMLHGLEQAFENDHGIEVLTAFLLSENVQKNISQEKITYTDLGFILLDAMKYDDQKTIATLLKPFTPQDPSLIREPGRMVYHALLEISRIENNEEFLAIVPKIFKGNLLTFLKEKYISIPSYPTLLEELFIRTTDTNSKPTIALFFSHPILGSLDPKIIERIPQENPLHNYIVKKFNDNCCCIIL